MNRIIHLPYYPFSTLNYQCIRINPHAWIYFARNRVENNWKKVIAPLDRFTVHRNQRYGNWSAFILDNHAAKGEKEHRRGGPRNEECFYFVSRGMKVAEAWSRLGFLEPWTGKCRRRRRRRQRRRLANASRVKPVMMDCPPRVNISHYTHHNFRFGSARRSPSK